MSPLNNSATLDILARIGLLVTNFANFEATLTPMLAVLLNDNGDRASVILGQVDSFAYKWGTVVGIAKLQEPPTDLSLAIVEADQKILRVNSFRNKVAHSGSRIQGDTYFLLQNSNTTKRGDVRVEILTKEALEEHNALLINTSAAMNSLINGVKLAGQSGLMRALRNTAGIPSEDQ
jgi:hypothetical protein